MTKFLVDTNVIIRYVVGDNLAQLQTVKQWFQEAEAGKRALIITPLVVAESIFVLESFYKQNRAFIKETFEVILSQKWLLVEGKDVLLNALVFYMAGLHFVDSILLARVKLQNMSLLTFDEQLQKKSV